MAKVFLNVGCGQGAKNRVVRGFSPEAWREIRFDVNPLAKPDIVGSIVNLEKIPDASIDAIYCSHTLEHVYAHEVPLAMAEFLRVLKPEGYVIATCPDLTSVCALIAQGKLHEVVYTSPAGPITPHDMLFGHGASLACGNLFMAHKCGFSQQSLMRAFSTGGFASVAGASRGRAPSFDIWVAACKTIRTPAALRAILVQHFPVKQGKQERKAKE